MFGAPLQQAAEENEDDGEERGNGTVAAIGVLPDLTKPSNARCPSPPAHIHLRDVSSAPGGNLGHDCQDVQGSLLDVALKHPKSSF